MSRRLWVDEMRDPARPPEQRAREVLFCDGSFEAAVAEGDRLLAEYAEEQRAREVVIAHTDGRVETFRLTPKGAKVLAALQRQRTVRASRARFIDRLGTVAGVIVLAAMAWVVWGWG